ncbi:hypothetical protein [Staphylococcus hominis]|uniref:hypothetical protein n=1 Tax=Staphylococcus hominis TaxID=1290 RepID=UPI00066B97A1|nr:hypothetical protein [Staphylococcus hominis]OFM94493.1 hypothetical protein HMPREF2639_03105 [Staphylococcus sp. HMSC078D05]AYY66653.1 hypothetical protein EGX58_06890 [Staphylococcus hominis]MBC2955495.1 hypothetical protein [Staphylococcus hominis]MCI2847460.1 hypothetical protein [Staphylococcus hominis]MCI2849553.1 hypothetical protein [Staphylococcus hominis]
MLRFINELIYICIITVFLNMHSQLHYALAFFLFSSMVAIIKFDIRDKQNSYFLKALKEYF